MQNKKIMITLASVCIALVAIVTALVIVLVSGGQGATSNITVKFVATDVACEIDAMYARVNMPALNTEYFEFNEHYGGSSMGSKLVINENTTSGELNPSGDITLDKTYSRVVFRYKVTNTMLSSPLYIELTGMPDNDTEGESFSNIVMQYYNEYVGEAAALFSGEYDSVFYDSMGKLVVPAQCTKYIYLVVTVASLTEDAEFTGQIEWTLTRGEKPTASYDDTNGKLTMTNIYEGCEVTESDLNHSTVNIRTLDWYTDTTVSAKAVFPITTTESTSLYSSYLKGNIAEENLDYYQYNNSLVVNKESLITNATSTVAGYTPITSTDTILVIPDMFQYSDGRLLPIRECHGSRGSYDNECILNYNYNITTVYMGNNIYSIACPTCDHIGDVLQNIYCGLDLSYISGPFSGAGESLTHIYLVEGTTNYWCRMNAGNWQADITEEVVSDPVAFMTFLKEGNFDQLERFWTKGPLY